jgi:hypothetical protein
MEFPVMRIRTPHSAQTTQGPGGTLVNRTQALGFFHLVWVSLVVILAAAPEVYDQALRLPPGLQRPVEIALLTALSAFIALLDRRCAARRFWLMLVAFLFGVLRVPAASLQLTRVLTTSAPTWVVFFQGLIGLVQFAIGLAMLTG